MFDYEQIKNPEFFKDHALPAHSDHVALPNEQSFFTGENAFRYSLNGLWKFSYGRNLTDCVMGFEAADYDCHNWQDIRVPAHIQMEGHDAPMYVNVQYPWEGHEELATGEVPEKFNPVASYVKYFSVPAHMKDQPLYISFQGVESGMAVWFNGHYIGYSEDSFTPTEFDLTPYVCDGENKLAVRVFKWTTGSWMEDQDFFRFSGIFRDVYLFTRPATDIYDLRVRTLLDDNYEKAELKADLKVTGTGTIKAKLVSLPLYAKSSLAPEIVTGRQHVRTVFESEIVLDGDNASTGDICTGNTAASYENAAPTKDATSIKDTVSINHNIESPANVTGHMATYKTYTYAISAKDLDVKLWSAEVPQLYELLLYVYNKENELTEIVSQLVGFRRFELKNTMMHLNGKRIVFKGVNRHEFSSKAGRVPQEDEILQDVLTMKRHNINAIRTSHYPNDSRIYQLCDRFGLYMIDETNMETHGTWGPYMFGVSSYDVVLPGDKPEWEAMMLDRVNSIWQRDKNHPAILIWSCGNESYGGLTIKKMSDLFHQLDSTRLVHYEGIFNDRTYPETSDIESQMYTPAAQIADFLKEHRDKPFICCEYTHAMGNSCGAMHKYTDLTDTEPLYQGGFIWDYVDQSIYKKDRYGQDFQAYGGDFDDRPSDYNFSGNGIVYGGDRTPSPKMQAVKYNYQNIAIIPSEDKVRIINKNLFVNTKAFTCTATLNRNGHCIGKFATNADVAPLSEGEFELPFDRQGIEGEYTVTVSFTLQADTPWANAGYEVAFGQYVYTVENVVADMEINEAGTKNSATDMSNSENKSNISREDETKINSKINENAALRSGSSNTAHSMTITQSFNNVGVRGDDFEVLFSFAEGGMTSYRYGGVEMIKAMPKPNFWRAPIDNDEGSMMPVRYGQWKLASMYCGNRYLGKWPGTNIDAALSKPPVIEAADDHLKITFTWFLRTIPDSSCDITYVVTADGTVEMTMSYDGVEGLPDMPEFGIIMKIDADYDHLEWYGLGPDETYVDRYQGAKLGIYKNLVKDNMAHYMVPQECGNKTGVRWAKVTDRRGRGLIFEGDAMHFSALPWTPHEIENTKHAYELPPVHYTVIRAAQMQMGVGGDNSWGARTHDEYLLPSNVNRNFTFRMRGI